MKQKQKKVLLIGPFPAPIHGESVAMELIYSSDTLHQLFTVKKIDTNRKNVDKQGKFSISKLLADLRIIAYILLLVCFNRTPIVYISISQSKLGLLRDCVIIYLCNMGKSKIISHLHGNNLSNVIDSFSGYSYKFVARAISKIDVGIVLDESLAFNYKGLVKNIRVVPNGVPDDFITREELKKRKRKERISLLYFSNLIKEKGYIKLVKAVNELIEENFKIELSLVGGVHDEKEFLEIGNYISQQNIDEQIVYYGIRSGKEKKQFFLNADIMLLPTNYKIEGQPISIIEGMAAGLPIISTHRGAIPSLIKDCGVLIEPEISEIKEAIKELYVNERYREKLGLASRSKYENFYTEKFFTNALVDLFSEIVS